MNHREPINRLAAQVVQPGTHFDPKKKLNQEHWDVCPPLLPWRKRPHESVPYLKGQRIGRLEVVGLYGGPGPLRWVVRCDCGKYLLRRTKSLRNPENRGDRCDYCRHLAHLKRTDDWRITQTNKDLRDY